MTPQRGAPTKGTALSSPVAPKRTAYLDILTCCAAFAVVFLHSNSRVHDYAAGPGWTFALAVEVAFYWAVPIFLMISGVNLMRYRDRYSTREFFSKRIKRSVIPFIVWALLSYVLITWVNSGLSAEMFSPRRLYEAVMLFPHMPIYWFFPALFAIYLAMPVLSLLREHRSALWYIVVLGLLVNQLLPFLAQTAGLPYNGALVFPLAAGQFVVFPVLGYLLATTDIPRRTRWIIYAAGALGLVVRFTVTYFASTAAGSTSTVLFDYVSLPSVALACAVFVAAKHVNWEPLLSTRSGRWWVAQITACSLGIYLIHMFAIWWLLPALGMPAGHLLAQTLGTLVVFGASLLAVSVLRRIPGVRAILPG